MKTTILAGALLFHITVMSNPGLGQPQHQFIENLLLSETDELPGIAWITSSTTIITKGRHDSIYFYHHGAEKVGTYKRVLSVDEQDSLQYYHRIACDWDSTYHEYEIAPEDPASERTGKMERRRLPMRGLTFYTVKHWPNIAWLEFSIGWAWPPRNRDFALIKAETTEEKKSELADYRSSSSYVSSDSLYSLTLHAYYDRVTTEMKKKVLEFEADGWNKPFTKTLDLIWQPVCNDCGLAVHYDGREARYGFIGGFRLSLFPIPILIFASGNVHEQAISFITFKPDGSFEEYRIIENRKDCLDR